MKKEHSVWASIFDRITLLSIILLGIVTIISSGGCDGDGEIPDFSIPPPPAEITQIYGLNFSPYIDDQDPNIDATVDAAQINDRLEIIFPYTRWIRTFGSTHGLEETGRLASQLGLNTAIGAWLDADLETNEQEIINLIATAQAGHADLLVVGNEVLLRGELTEAQLLEYIQRVKRSVSSTIKVTYADVYGVLLDHPAIIEAVDIVFANYYPYWEGIDIDTAIAALHRWHQQVVAAADSKEVVVSETGWPSDGEPYGNAVPSLENASDYFLNFVSWADANSVNYFYFEAFDEAWKAFYEGPQGAHWGVWDQYGNLKEGMQAVFDGDVVDDNWSEVPILYR